MYAAPHVKRGLELTIHEVHVMSVVGRQVVGILRLVVITFNLYPLAFIIATMCAHWHKSKPTTFGLSRALPLQVPRNSRRQTSV